MVWLDPRLAWNLCGSLYALSQRVPVLPSKAMAAVLPLSTEEAVPGLFNARFVVPQPAAEARCAANADTRSPENRVMRMANKASPGLPRDLRTAGTNVSETTNLLQGRMCVAAVPAVPDSRIRCRTSPCVEGALWFLNVARG